MAHCNLVNNAKIVYPSASLGQSVSAAYRNALDVYA